MLRWFIVTQIQYDDKALSMTLKEQEAKASGPKKPAVAEVAAAVKEEEEEGSDIDIDDL